MTFAPTDAQYLTLAANGVLTDYRILDVGAMLVAVDGGPAGAYTLNVDPTQIDHASLAQLTTGNPHSQYLLGTILSSNGGILTRVAGSPANLPIGSAGQVLTAVGGLPSWATPAAGAHLLDSQPTETLIVSSATLDTLYTFSVPANTLAAGDLLRLRILADYLNNSGSNRTVTFKASLGGQVLYEGNTGNIATGATRRATTIDLVFAVRGQNPNVRLAGLFQVATGTAPTTGISSISGSLANTGPLLGDVNVTLSNANTLLIQIQHSASASTIELRARGMTLEHVPA